MFRSTARLPFAALLFAGILSVQSPRCLLGQSSPSQPPSTAPQPKGADPAASVPVVVELFTSEGCSSCPPADVILQRLDEFQPIAGAQLIVMSEHVTYWDQDGWKDPNSSPAFTERQNAYEPTFKEKEPFTPQFVVDGTREAKIDKLAEMEGVLKQAKDDPKIPVRLGEINFDAGNPAQLRTHVETDANSTNHGADVFVAIALDHVESQVLHGENGGKHLVHVAVVQEVTKVGKLPKGKSLNQDVVVKLKPGTDPKNVRVIAFIQEPGPGPLLSATMRKPGS